MSKNEDAKSKLIKIAARLLSGLPLSDDDEDYSFKIPKHHLRKISDQTESMRLMAIEIRDITNRM